MFSMGVILFMMLAGRAPFDGETDEEANAATLKGEYNWPKEPQVSESAKNLVDNLLNQDYTKRMTASEALNHSWIEHEEHSTISLNSVVARLQTFSAAQMMKKAVASIWRKVMDDEDSHRVRDLFQQLDADGDRILDCEELTSYLQQHGYEDIEDAKAAAQRLVDSTPESKQVHSLVMSIIFAFSLYHRISCREVA
jgi:calcium-dependent protein kinase